MHPMESTLAWIWAPLVLGALCFGLGLLVEAVTRFRLAATVTVGVGFCLGILIVDCAYRLGAHKGLVAGVVVAAALAGLALRRTGLRERLRTGAAALAGLAAYCLYLAPVALSGSWTWAGYNYTNDPANTMTTTAWIASHGSNLPPVKDHSTSTAVAWDFVHAGYPLGAHLLMATVQPLTGAPLMALYQPFIAFSVALAAAAFTHLARRAGLPWIAAGLAAFFAIGADLLYVYGQLGGVKELVTVTALAVATAVAAARPLDEWNWSTVATAAVPLAALVPVLSAGGVAYAGLFGLVLCALALAALRRPSVRGVQPLRRLAGYAALGVVLFLSFSAPSLADALRFGSTVNDELSGTVLGQLLRPLPLEQVGGIWWAEDWRLPVAAGVRWDLNRLALALIFVLAAVGIVLVIRRRRGAILVGLLAVAGAAAAIGPRTSPYGESKLYVILSPFVVLAAALGVWALWSRSRVAGSVVALFLAGGILYSDAIAYREVRLAPIDRMQAMEDIARVARGHGLVLHNENEEWAKYFYRDGQVDSPGEIWFGPHPWELRTGFAQVAQHYDLDEVQLSFANAFPVIVTRRSPDASRPPASFRLAYENRYYEMWLRNTRSTAWLRHDSGTGVLRHLPIQGAMASQARVQCSRILRFARQAAPGQMLVAAHRPDDVALRPTQVRRSFGWASAPDLPGTIFPMTPGQASAKLFVPGGRYRVWMYGTSGRAINAIIDGRRVGSFKQVNTPRQWNDVATVSLARGRHELEMQRPGGSFAPGNAYLGRLGPLVLQPIARDTLERVRPADARSLCGKALDWVEIVEPGVARG
jgi:hypothetical protein